MIKLIPGLIILLITCYFIIFYLSYTRDNYTNMKVHPNKKITDSDLKLKLQYVDFLSENYKPNYKNIDIPIYYINLDRSIDRNSHMKEQIKKYNIKNIKRVRAVDGKEINDSKNIMYDTTMCKNRFNDYQLACTLSHVNAVKQMINDDIDYGLVIEDDVNFCLSRMWDNSLREIADKYKDYDSIKLFNGSCINVGKDTVEKIGNNCYSTVAIIYTKQGMKKLLERVQYNKDIISIGTSTKTDCSADLFIYNTLDKTINLNKPMVIPFMKGMKTTLGSNDTVHLQQSSDVIDMYLEDAKFKSCEINKVMHFVWFNFNKQSPFLFNKLKRYRESCIDKHKGWDIKLWGEDDAELIVKKNFPNYYETVYKKYPNKVEHVDAFRYILMYIYGGLYLDTDIYCFKNLEPLIENVIVGVGDDFEHDNKTVMNDILYSCKPRHPFWGMVIENMMTSHTNVKVSNVTGPTFLNSNIIKWNNLFPYSKITLFPVSKTRMFDWRKLPPKGCSSNNNDKDFDKCISNAPDDLYMMTSYSASWF